MKIRSDHGGQEKIGWGGRIRTFTVHINSVVSYRLDHAPAALSTALQPPRAKNPYGRAKQVGSAACGATKGLLKITRPNGSTMARQKKDCVLLAGWHIYTEGRPGPKRHALSDSN